MKIIKYEIVYSHKFNSFSKINLVLNYKMTTGRKDQTRSFSEEAQLEILNKLLHSLYMEIERKIRVGFEQSTF